MLVPHNSPPPSIYLHHLALPYTAIYLLSPLFTFYLKMVLQERHVKLMRLSIAFFQNHLLPFFAAMQRNGGSGGGGNCVEEGSGGVREGATGTTTALVTML